MAFNVNLHQKVPRHEKLSEAEKKELYSKYSITIAELPRILKNDPAIKSLKLKGGDVVKITRNSPTAGESFYYRGVADE
jgi:DNA-directed RNA polymerase subunit H